MTAGDSHDQCRLQMARALVVTGLILYVPANILPVMTMTVVGDLRLGPVADRSGRLPREHRGAVLQARGAELAATS
jgi:hypothetical protein